jgi:hypothetical protein
MKLTFASATNPKLK